MNDESAESLAPRKPFPQPILDEAYLLSQGFSNTFLLRFWNKVFIPTENPETACWIWTAAKTWKGYGYITRCTGHQIHAHQASWIIHFGAIPDSLCVLHTCDNRPCIRPDHLWLGTGADNSGDMVSKGRSTRGERSHFAKLDAEKVNFIRAAYKSGKHDQESLAEMFGVIQQTISCAILRKSWKHLL